jgi:hypothetical protein
MDSMGCTCASYASDVLGACIMITSALHSYRELNAGKRNVPSLIQQGSYQGFFGISLHRMITFGDSVDLCFACS